MFNHNRLNFYITSVKYLQKGRSFEICLLKQSQYIHSENELSVSNAIPNLTLEVLKVTAIVGINCLREVFQLKESISKDLTEDQIRSQVLSLRL